MVLVHVGIFFLMCILQNIYDKPEHDIHADINLAYLNYIHVMFINLVYSNDILRQCMLSFHCNIL